jgi:hypothetical protein
MSHSDDVGNLFRRFGGDAADYQELAHEADLNLARQRWPMLSARLDGERPPIPPATPAGAAPGCARPVAIPPVPPVAVATPGADGVEHLVPPFLRRGAPPVAAPIHPRSPAVTPAVPAVVLPVVPAVTAPAAMASAPQPSEPGALSALFRRLEGTPAAAPDLSSSLRKLAGAGKPRP